MTTNSIERPFGPQETHSETRSRNNIERPLGPRETHSEGRPRAETLGHSDGKKTQVSRPQWVPRTGPPWGPSQGTREQYRGSNNTSTLVQEKGKLTQRTWISVGLRPLSSGCNPSGKHGIHNLGGENQANTIPPPSHPPNRRST